MSASLVTYCHGRALGYQLQLTLRPASTMEWIHQSTLHMLGAKYQPASYFSTCMLYCYYRFQVRGDLFFGDIP